jgi:hypothetical protein
VETSLADDFCGRRNIYRLQGGSLKCSFTDYPESGSGFEGHFRKIFTIIETFLAEDFRAGRNAYRSQGRLFEGTVSDYPEFGSGFEDYFRKTPTIVETIRVDDFRGDRNAYRPQSRKGECSFSDYPEFGFGFKGYFRKTLTMPETFLADDFHTRRNVHRSQARVGFAVRFFRFFHGESLVADYDERAQTRVCVEMTCRCRMCVRVDDVSYSVRFHGSDGERQHRTDDCLYFFHIFLLLLLK